jgi:transposase
MVCAQARMSGVSVAQVARRYDLNANQIFNWLKDPRFGPEEGDETDTLFLPVEIVEETARKEAPQAAPEGVIELSLAGGHRVRISGRYDPEALARLIRCLSG